MKKFITLILLLTTVIIHGQTKVGSTAAAFLDIGVGSRPVSMGGAFIATANDVTALYWNPAGISRANSNQAMFTHTKWFADITYDWAGAMLNLGSMGTFGLSMTYLNYGDMEVTTLGEPEGTGEMFSAKDLSLGLSYAYNLTDRFSIGASFKYVNQKIWNSSASAMAVDLGVLFVSDINDLRIGATITNFGSDMKLDGKDLYVLHDIDPNHVGNNDQIMALLKTDSYPLPLTFKVGLAMDLYKTDMHKVTLGADAIHSSDNAECLNVGGEYVFANMIALRAGYKSLLLTNTEEGLTLGVGINYDFASDFGIFVDYAYQDFGVLKNTQHFSLGVRF